MPKKFNVKGTKIEENQYYKVIKPEDAKNKKFYIYSKYDDTVYVCKTYKIIGAAVLEDNGDSKFYSNYVNMQKFGKVSFQRVEIASWDSKVIDGAEQTKIVYINERDQKFVRFIDENGNLYKKQTAKKEQELVASI